MFSTIDWFIFCSYFFILALSSFILSRKKVISSRDYFTASNSMPTLTVAISILATSQSAATFLGAPEFSYSNNFTFIGFYISSLLAVLFVNYFFLPKFYAIKAVTVYEFLEIRYGKEAKEYAGIAFLIGRVMASGARLYIGSLAISMILFNDIQIINIIISIIILIFGALAYTYFGGIRSIIYSDIIQAVIYVSAGIGVLIFLLHSLQNVDIITILQKDNKLQFFDNTIDAKFSIISLISGWFLLNIAAFGLDQDITQRVLSCKNQKDASKALIISILLTIPIVLIFLSIGALLYVFYIQSDVVQHFQGSNITIFMYYILNEMPEGLRALVTVGAISAALSSTNSVLGAMASVAIEDFYKPYKLKHSKISESKLIKASRIAVVLFAIILSFMAILSYYWQQYSKLPLISFALGVMTFTYTGLLGVYLSAFFTTRGNSKTVAWALIAGFVSVLSMQPYIFGIDIGFSWSLVFATLIAFLVMQMGVKNE